MVDWKEDSVVAKMAALLADSMAPWWVDSSVVKTADWKAGKQVQMMAVQTAAKMVVKMEHSLADMKVA